jgi:hypothetical protein
MTAKPKRKPRKVVVWAVVWSDGLSRGRGIYFRKRKSALDHIKDDGKWFRIVRCEGVLR